MTTDWISYEDFLEAKYPTFEKTHPGFFLKKTMTPEKVEHSFRVTQTLEQIGIRNRDVVNAALFHDYLECGGDIMVAARTLGFSDRTIRLIECLTNDSKWENPYLSNGPLLHLQNVLETANLDEMTKNYLILIKIADRLDNLERKITEGVSRNYLKKSKELLKWLFENYTGDINEADCLRRRLKDLGVKIKKKEIGGQE